MNGEQQAGGTGMSRREFVQAAAIAGAGLTLGLPAWAQETRASAEEVAVAIIGPGSQGINLVNNCLKIPGIRFTAICDIWEYSQKRSSGLLGKYDQTVNVYEDYREMLDKEKHIDAVIVATPDWMHAEHANACLKAGKHVYCEKEMSNTVEGAASMVKTARESGKLLQIGHQRRSNPRYWHAIKLIENDKILGRITHVNGQWNRAKRLDVGWPSKYEMSDEKLKQYGYGSMDEMRNWRWYRKYSGGPMADLGSHQIDVYNWVLKSHPKAVMASGGLDYYVEKGRDWYDNVMAIYEYQTAQGVVRAFYEVLNTTSSGGFFETFMGDEGTMTVSEDPRKGHFFRELTATRRDWEAESEMVEQGGREMFELKIGETLAPDGSKDPEGQRLLEEIQKPVHQLHLENFFNAVRSGTPLSCPPEIGFETCVTVMKANEAVAKGCRMDFEPSEFEA